MKFSKIALSALSFAVLGFLALGLVSMPAAAATTTVSTTFNVTATVNASCGITAAPLGFGTYTGAAVQASSNLTITCDTAVPTINVGLSTGNNGAYVAGTTYTRKMANGAAMLNYGLYQNAGDTTQWGTTTSTDTLLTAYTTTAVTVPVNGLIPAGQVVTTGSYSDTITAYIYF